MNVSQIQITQIRGAAFDLRSETKGVDPDLRESIKSVGLMQPILLRPAKKSGYEVIAGLRRFEACKDLKFKTISAVVEKLDDKAAFEIMLSENIQRKQLTPLEEAKAFKVYLGERKWGSLSELSNRIKKSHSYVLERISLLDWSDELPERVQREIVSSEKVSTSHIREISRAKLEKPEQIRQLVRAVEEDDLTSEQTAVAAHLVREQDMPVETAVKTALVADRMREVANRVSDALQRAVIQSASEIKDVESSEGRRLMEDYMYLGTILEALRQGKIYCLDRNHNHKENMLVWKGCDTTIEETHRQLEKRLTK